MLIGVPTEVKNREYRVAMTAAGVYELVHAGHQVLIQEGAGNAAGILDSAYEAAGAEIVPTAKDVWGRADMIVKVKEPLPSEYDLMREGQILFTYLHLAAAEGLTHALMDRKVTSIAYEMVQMPDRSLPLLAPMSAIAGRLATQVAAYQLMSPMGGPGLLMGGVPGTPEAKVVVIGGGVVGEQAAIMARGLHATVTVMDVNLPRLNQIATTHNGDILTRYNTRHDLQQQLLDADVVIGSVLLPGKKAPKLVTDEMVQKMKPGAILVDVAIDQGGCFENSRPTTHDEPTFRVHDTTFYCVANMPGSVPVTATVALTNATLPYILRIAGQGWKAAAAADSAIAKGVSTFDGALFSAPVGDTFGIEVKDIASVL